MYTDDSDLVAVLAHTGHFKLNNLDGVGEMRWPDGRSFRGSFKNNRDEGHLFKDAVVE